MPWRLSSIISPSITMEGSISIFGYLLAQFCPLHYLIVPHVLYPCPLNNAVSWIFYFFFLFFVGTHNFSCSTVTVVGFPVRPSILYPLFNNHTRLLTPSRTVAGREHPALSPAVFQACWTFFFSAPLGSTPPTQFSPRQVSTTEFTYSKLPVTPILHEFLKNINYAGAITPPFLGCGWSAVHNTMVALRASDLKYAWHYTNILFLEVHLKFG